MSIRVALLFLFVAGFSVYAWRNWFVSLCGAITLMAVIQHPDMPRNIGEIQGLNPWNFLILNVTLAWARSRSEEGRVWDMPRYVLVLLGFYLSVILVSALRLIFGNGDLWGFESGYIISEHMVNCLKWVVPCLLLFDACRTPDRVRIAAAVILLPYFLLAVQVIRWVPLSAAAAGPEMNRITARFIQNEIGFNRVTLSMMLGGASWATLCCLGLARNWRERLCLLGASAIIAVGQALTGGRTGYVSWLMVGVVLSLLRWRRLLLVIPVVVTIVFTAMPGVRDRFLQGFAGDTGNVIVKNDDYEITSGRTLAWPLVIDKIQENPIFGYGREAMKTTGIANYLWNELREAFPHPHNAYLEVLLDNGILGFLGVIPFYLVVLWQAVRLLLDRSDPFYSAIGGMTCSLILALLVGAMGGQTFYPREGSLGMWAAIGLMLRVAVERQRSIENDEPFFPQDESELQHDETEIMPA